MHELSITRNIVALVAEAAGHRKVKRVTVAIGEHAGVMSEAVAFCFDVVAQRTVVEGAVLEIIKIAGRVRCEGCGAESPTGPAGAAEAGCACSPTRRRRIAGDELVVRSMEIED